MESSTTSYFSYKNIWKIAYPIILGSLAQDIITVVDTAFIGRLGEVELGGAALGGIFYLAIVMIGWGFSLGVQILIARRYGENDVKSIGKIFYHSLFFLLVIASTIFITIRHFKVEIFSALIESDEVTNQTLKFINYRIFGLFAAFINVNFRAFYIGTGNTRVIIYTTLIMSIVNIILDYFLIFGIGIFPQMNIEGAALASVIAEFCATLFFIVYTYVTANNQRFTLFKWHDFDRKITQKILSIASPTMIQNSISFLSWFAFFVFVEKMGETTLAISNIIRSIYILVLVPIFGFASATNTLISYSIGLNKLEHVGKIIKRSIFMAVSAMFVLVLVGLSIPRQIISIYTDNQEIITQTLPVFYIVMIASLTIAVGFILFQSVSGTGKTMVSLFIEMLAISFYLGGVYFISKIPNATVALVWSVEIYYGISLGILSLIYLRFGNWKSNRI